MTDNRQPGTVATEVDNEFRWQTVLTQVIHSHKIVKMIEKNESVAFKYEKHLVDFLKSLSFKEQQTLEEHSLTSVNVQPPNLDEKAFRELKEELLAEDRSIDEQYRYCKTLTGDKKINWLVKIAKTGYRLAQFDLGYHYHFSSCLDDAKYWYKKASDQGCASSKYNFAILSGKDDPQTSFELFKQISQYEENNSKPVVILAHKAMGDCYYTGSGVQVDFKLAFAFYLKGAIHNNSNAQLQLAHCYEYGKGVEINPKSSFDWYTKSARNENVLAQYNLAFCYQDGFGTPPNSDKAFEWFLKAANNGDARSQNKVAIYYSNGIGILKNAQQAIEWYTISANNGNAMAQCNLAECYENGDGVKKDAQQAFEWYTRSAEQENAIAQCCLGICYLNGFGVAKDKAKAIDWFTRAAKLGDSRAQIALTKCQAS